MTDQSMLSISYTIPGLPQNTRLIKTLRESNRYEIGRGETVCFPFDFKAIYYRSCTIDAADTTYFEGCFTQSLIAWPSVEPAGNSLISIPLESVKQSTLTPSATVWNFFITDGVTFKNPSLAVDLEKFKCHPMAFVNQELKLSTKYWFNIKNQQNTNRSFFLRFDFSGIMQSNLYNKQQ